MSDRLNFAYFAPPMDEPKYIPAYDQVNAYLGLPPVPVRGPSPGTPIIAAQQVSATPMADYSDFAGISNSTFQSSGAPVSAGTNWDGTNSFLGNLNSVVSTLGSTAVNALGQYGNYKTALAATRTQAQQFPITPQMIYLGLGAIVLIALVRK